MEDEERPRKRGSRAWIGWVLFILLLGGAGAFIWYLYMPLRATRASLESDLVRAGERERMLNGRIKEGEERITKLGADCDKVASELKQTVAEKEKIESELKGVQNELAKKLEPEIQAGNVRLRRRGQELVLDMADEILFDTGQAEVSERGQSVLMQVARSLAELRTYAIQVAGHTDGTRITNVKTQERFPTNWELSSARATNVVRFLQERGKIPGQRLVAAGFGEFRPTASNSNDEGRRKNRRIEILLLPIGGDETVAKIH